MSLVTRVHALIALSGSDNEHEAKNAAVQACKLIRDNKLTVTDIPQPKPAPRVHAQDPGQRPVHEVAAEIFRSSRPGKPVGARPAEHSSDYSDVEAKMDAYEEELAQERAVKAARGFGARPDLFPKVRSVVMANPDDTPMKLKTAKYPGKCMDCGKAYAQGISIWYRRGVGCVHGDCDPEALV